MVGRDGTEVKGAEMKYKFDRYDYLASFDDIYILPTVRVSSQYELIDKNFNIQFHWFGFHLRWRWIQQ